MGMKLIYGEGCWPHFEQVDDTVRGGKSHSFLVSDSADGGVHFYGQLDITALGGAGFASQRAILHPALSLSPSQSSGLRVSVHAPQSGDYPPEKYPAVFVLALKTAASKPAHSKTDGDDEKKYRDDGRRKSSLSYEFTFNVAGTPDDLARPSSSSSSLLSEKRADNVIHFDAPWSAFKPTYRGRDIPDAPALDSHDIRELSFMCRSDFGKQSGPFSLHITAIQALPPQQAQPSVLRRLGQLLCLLR